MTTVVGPWSLTDDVVDETVVSVVATAFAGQRPRALVLGADRGRIERIVDRAGFDRVALTEPTLDTDRLQAVIDTHGPPDVVILVDGMQRAARILDSARLDALLSWVADTSVLAVLQAPRVPIMPGAAELGPYRAGPILDAFAYVSEHTDAATAVSPMPPRLFASNHLLRIGDQWRRMDTTSHAKTPWSRTRPLSGGLVYKVDSACEDYLERSEVAREARFLLGADTETRTRLRLPPVVNAVFGHAVNTLLRGAINGRSIDRAGAAADRDLFDAVLAEAQRYAALGLFHNDIRPWNLVWDDTRATFVDYADIAPEDADTEGLPQLVALGACLARLVYPDVVAGLDFPTFAWNLWSHTDSAHVVSSEALAQAWPALAHVRSSALRMDSPVAVMTSLAAAVLAAHRDGLSS